MATRGDVGPSAAMWWRASKYEFVGGTHIRPARGASIETFDLMADYKRFWDEDDGATPLYMTLQQLNLEDDAAVLDWCARFGLLGILHSQLVSIALWPTWESKLLAGLEQLRPCQRVLWETEAFDRFPEQKLFADAPAHPNDSPHHEAKRQGHLLTPGEYSAACYAPGSMLRPPMATIRDLDTGELKSVSVAEAYGQFFPDVPGVREWFEIHPLEQDAARRSAALREVERARYPHPGTEEFRRLYSEPRHLFDQVVRGLRVREFDEHDRPKAIPKQAALKLRQIRPVSRPIPGNATQLWDVPSLVAACSLMMVMDVVLGDATMPKCVKCPNRFVKKHPSRVHCSEQCKKALEMRRYRARRAGRTQRTLRNLEEQQ